MSDLCRDDDAGDDDDDITSRTSPGRMGPLAWHCLPPGIIVPAELFYYFCPCLTPAGNKKIRDSSFFLPLWVSPTKRLIKMRLSEVPAPGFLTPINHETELRTRLLCATSDERMVDSM
ncbi:hypothetical protein RUM43_003306 [Polyplax serrata]|uniref:Uncharacterized protein n=1 Tax=Polyplax serrata TaxID=468196 RepID=A0AAN8NV83_POLSC